jgi:predicted DNA binding CopG/RHH family protein
MAKKESGSSAPGKRTAKNAKHMPDSEIDYSDIPESTDAELKKARRVGRPKSAETKQLIAIRLDPKLIKRLKKLAKNQDVPYQTLIHQLLEDAVDEVA